MAESLQPAEAFAALARRFAQADGVAPTLHQVVTAALEMVPCDWAAAAVTDRLTQQRPRLAESTDEAMATVTAEIAGNAGASPGISAHEDGTVVYCPDLTDDARYEPYARAMVARTPIRSVLSVPLCIDGTPAGVMSLYAATPRAFDEYAVERAQLLAEHASLAIAAARDTERADQLQVALENSRVIGTAMGILVERYRLTPEQAFLRLREASQDGNRKLAEVAEDLVRTGALGERTDTAR